MYSFWFSVYFRFIYCSCYYCILYAVCNIASCTGFFSSYRFLLIKCVWITDFSMQLFDKRSKSGICFSFHSFPRFCYCFTAFFFFSLLALVCFAQKPIQVYAIKILYRFLIKDKIKWRKQENLLWYWTWWQVTRKHTGKTKKKKKRKQTLTKRISFFRVSHLRTYCTSYEYCICTELGWTELICVSSSHFYDWIDFKCWENEK